MRHRLHGQEIPIATDDIIGPAGQGGSQIGFIIIYSVESATIPDSLPHLPNGTPGRIGESHGFLIRLYRVGTDQPIAQM